MPRTCLLLIGQSIQHHFDPWYKLRALFIIFAANSGLASLDHPWYTLRAQFIIFAANSGLASLVGQFIQNHFDPWYNLSNLLPIQGWSVFDPWYKLRALFKSYLLPIQDWPVSLVSLFRITLTPDTNWELSLSYLLPIQSSFFYIYFLSRAGQSCASPRLLSHRQCPRWKLEIQNSLKEVVFKKKHLYLWYFCYVLLPPLISISSINPCFRRRKNSWYLDPLPPLGIWDLALAHDYLWDISMSTLPLFIIWCRAILEPWLQLRLSKCNWDAKWNPGRRLPGKKLLC